MSKMKAFAEFGVFRSFQLSVTNYEFKIFKSRKLAGLNFNNDFQGYLAGSTVSLQNDP